jgi:hypothetical protein
MRAQKVRVRDAEVQKSLAEAEHQRALAASLGQTDCGGTGSNAIVEMVADTARKSLRVQARWPVAAGHWDLFLDAECKSTCKLKKAAPRRSCFAGVLPRGGWTKKLETPDHSGGKDDPKSA